GRDDGLTRKGVGGVLADQQLGAPCARDVLALVVITEPDLVQPGRRIQGALGEFLEALEGACRRSAIGATGRINELAVRQCGNGRAERNVPDLGRRPVLCRRDTRREPSRQRSNERDLPPPRERDQLTPRGALVVVARPQTPNTATIAHACYTAAPTT